MSEIAVALVLAQILLRSQGRVKTKDKSLSAELSTNCPSSGRFQPDYSVTRMLLPFLFPEPCTACACHLKTTINK